MANSRKYSIDGEQNIAAPTVSLLGLTGSAAVEPSVFFLAMGSEGTPADAAFIWYIGRHTAAGTATAVTPQNLGPSAVASVTSAGENHTAEPTLTANAILFRLGLNQRAAHSIIFDPEGCLTAVATANNGMTLYPTHASSTILCSATMHFRE